MLISTLRPLVIAEAPDIPVPVIDTYLILAARELCNESRVWKTDVTFSVTGAATYTPALPADAEIAEPTSAAIYLSSTAVSTTPKFKTSAQLDMLDPLWRSRTGNPTWFTLPAFNTIQLVPNPPTGGSITVPLALRPTLTATTIDDRVGNRFNEVLAHGALGKLLLMNRRSWYNPQGAAYFSTLFAEEKNHAETVGADGYARAARKVRYGGY